MFRSTLKKVTAFALAALMTVSMVHINTASVEAASSYPTKIYLNKKTVSLAAGKTYKLRVTGSKPYGLKYRTVKWSTSNKKVATVSSYGTVKGISAGTALITATSTRNTKVKATCAVTVYKYGWKRVEPTVKNGLYTYKLPNSTASFGFNMNGKPYKVTDSYMKTFMSLFGNTKNNLISRWKARRTTVFQLGPIKASITGIRSERTLKISGLEAYKGTYKIRLYDSKSKYANGHDNVFAIKGEKTDNKWVFVYVDSTKTQYTYTTTGKQGIQYTLVANKKGNAGYLKAGKKVLYKYTRTSASSEFSFDASIVMAKKVKGYYWGRK